MSQTGQTRPNLLWRLCLLPPSADMVAARAKHVRGPAALMLSGLHEPHPPESTDPTHLGGSRSSPVTGSEAPKGSLRAWISSRPSAPDERVPAAEGAARGHAQSTTIRLCNGGGRVLTCGSGDGVVGISMSDVVDELRVLRAPRAARELRACATARHHCDAPPTLTPTARAATGIAMAALLWAVRHVHLWRFAARQS
jgi:hypothetical protein